MLQIKLMIPIAELGRQRRTTEISRCATPAANVECTVGVRVRCIEISRASERRRQLRVSDIRSSASLSRSPHSVGTLCLDGPFKSFGASAVVVRRGFGPSAIRRTMRGLFWAIVFEGAAAACLYAVWYVWHSSR